VALDEGADAGLDDVVAAAAVGEDAELVVHFLGAIHADGDADVVLGEEPDDVGREQGGVGGEAEIDGAALRGGLLVGVGHHLLEQREVHEGLAAEESDVDGAAAGGLFEQKIHRGAGRVEIHEFRLALGGGDFIFAEFVAVLAGKVALVGEVEDQGLQGEDGGRVLRRRGDGWAGDDGAGVKHFLDQLFGVFGGQAAGGEIGEELVVRGFGVGEEIDEGGGGFVELEDGSGGDEVEESAAAAFEGVEFAEAVVAGGGGCGGHWETSGKKSVETNLGPRGHPARRSACATVWVRHQWGGLVGDREIIGRRQWGWRVMAGVVIGPPRAGPSGRRWGR